MNAFDINNPNLDDLGELLQEAIELADHHGGNRDIVITLATVSTRTAALWNGYLNNLQKLIKKANTSEYSMSIETPHYYKEPPPSEGGTGQWVDDICLRVFKK